MSFCCIAGNFIFSDSLGHGESDSVKIFEFRSLVGEISWVFHLCMKIFVLAFLDVIFFCGLTLIANISVSFCPIMGNFIFLDSLGSGESNGVKIFEFRSLVGEILMFPICG